MKFHVRFTTPDGPVARIDTRDVGLAGLDEARHEAELPELDPKLVDSSTPSLWRGDVSLELTEDQARAAGLFETVNTVRVDVPRYSLNSFYHRYPAVERDPNDGRVKRVRWKYALDGETLINDWFAAGCPTEWDPTATENEGGE